MSKCQCLRSVLGNEAGRGIVVFVKYDDLLEVVMTFAGGQAPYPTPTPHSQRCRVQGPPPPPSLIPSACLRLRPRWSQSIQYPIAFSLRSPSWGTRPGTLKPVSWHAFQVSRGTVNKDRSMCLCSSQTYELDVELTLGILSVLQTF